VTNRLATRWSALVGAVLALLVVGVTGAVVHFQAAQISTERTVRVNQCEVLNRLAETKLFIRDFLRENATPDNPAEARRFALADEHLSTGINSLVDNVQRLDGCAVFPILARRAD
jgi:hypothetical protein